MTLEISWPEVLVAALALTSVGQRALKWAWGHRELVRQLYSAVEQWANGGSTDAKAIKARVDIKTAAIGGATRRRAELLAAWAESRNEGGSTRHRQAQRTGRKKAGDVVKGIARWLPVVGALLD